MIIGKMQQPVVYNTLDTGEYASFGLFDLKDALIVAIGLTALQNNPGTRVRCHANDDFIKCFEPHIATLIANTANKKTCLDKSQIYLQLFKQFNNEFESIRKVTFTPNTRTHEVPEVYQIFLCIDGNFDHDASYNSLHEGKYRVIISKSLLPNHFANEIQIESRDDLIAVVDTIPVRTREVDPVDASVNQKMKEIQQGRDDQNIQGVRKRSPIRAKNQSSKKQQVQGKPPLVVKITAPRNTAQFSTSHF